MSAASIVFAGTPDFACVSLQALLASGQVPVAALTQPDRPAGRGKKLRASAVKLAALEHDIPLWQPQSLRDPGVQADLASLEPDILIVAAYGLMLPPAVLSIPRKGCLNVHASLLPRWRGAAPIQHAILSGDAETGVCLMQMEAGLDTGPVYVSQATQIGPAETAGQLHDRLSAMGGALLVKRLAEILAGSLLPVPQDESLASYAGKISREHARIDWRQKATQIDRLIRAYNPVPGAWFDYRGEAIKCWQAGLLESAAGPPGQVMHVDEDGLDVACGSGAIRLQVLQRPGRGRVQAAELARQIEFGGQRLGDPG